MSRVLSLSTTIVLLTVLAPVLSGAEGTDFTYSTDPDHVVLFVAVVVAQTGINRSMTLYGDGRLTAAQLGNERNVIRERDFSLSPSEVRDLLWIAIEHDLPGYDETNIHARQLRGKTTPGFGGVVDGSTTLINISLESFTKDGRNRGRLDKKLSVDSARHAASRFPDIPEFKGIQLLEDQLYAFWKKAGWPLW